MVTRSYESARVLVFDPVASNRNATRASLHSLGFRNVELAATIDILANQLKLHSPDLLLAEVTGTEAEVCQFVQAVRQGEYGGNPFVVIIVTTWRRDGAVVSKVINSGADDLVARPLSTSMLRERINLQIDRRKGFVVTSDYIGPDRRRDPSRPGGETIEVPNSLKVRIADNLPEDEAERRILYAIEQGKEIINAQKIRRDSILLCSQWRTLEQRPQGTREFFETVARLGRIASGIKRRLIEGDRSSADELCDAIAVAAETIQSARGDAGIAGTDLTVDYQPNLEKLGTSAVGLGRIFAPGEAEMPAPAPREAPIMPTQVKAA